MIWAGLLWPAMSKRTMDDGLEGRPSSREGQTWQTFRGIAILPPSYAHSLLFPPQGNPSSPDPTPSHRLSFVRIRPRLRRSFGSHSEKMSQGLYTLMLKEENTGREKDIMYIECGRYYGVVVVSVLIGN